MLLKKSLDWDSKSLLLLIAHTQIYRQHYSAKIRTQTRWLQAMSLLHRYLRFQLENCLSCYDSAADCVSLPLVSRITIALSSPFPLTQVTISDGVFMSSFLNMLPILSAFLAKPSSSITYRKVRRLVLQSTEGHCICFSCLLPHGTRGHYNCWDTKADPSKVPLQT